MTTRLQLFAKTVRRPWHECGEALSPLPLARCEAVCRATTFYDKFYGLDHRKKAMHSPPAAVAGPNAASAPQSFPRGLSCVAYLSDRGGCWARVLSSSARSASARRLRLYKHCRPCRTRRGIRVARAYASSRVRSPRTPTALVRKNPTMSYKNPHTFPRACQSSTGCPTKRWNISSRSSRSR